MPILKVISGGQTGADRGGLEAAIYCDVIHGGWCPKGRKAEDGEIPANYQLKETSSPEYLGRTEANVVDSDATVIFTFGTPTGGSLRTLEFCQKHSKPWHHIDLITTLRGKALKEIVKWLQGDPALNDYEDYEAKPPASCVLNVAGSRESRAKGIQDLVMAIMVDVLKTLNPECEDCDPLL